MGYQQLEMSTVQRLEQRLAVTEAENRRLREVVECATNLANSLGHWSNELSEGAQCDLALLRAALRETAEGKTA